MSNPKDKKDIDYGWENDLITDDEIKLMIIIFLVLEGRYT